MSFCDSQVSNRMLRPRLDSIVVQQALDLGYHRSFVRAAVTNRLKKLAPDYTRLADLVKDVIELTPPDPKRIVEAKEYLLPDLLAEPNSDEKTDSHEDDTPVPVPHETQLVQTNSKNTPDIKETDSATPGELDLDGLAEKAYTSQLISQLTCKVCLSDLVAIIFLPCGHCVCCTNCSPSMSECPICREGIRGTIRAKFPP
ncbi:BIRC7 [Bugula neritina]|uniref:BIRC7 n=1 Tax=Bugula neritina TaxID=10212 RepID=A0A7J7K552_BUGNE|nr:BIRC7 [Bugula neritina]